MKTLLVYSSKTGNTEKIAEAISERLEPDGYQRIKETDKEAVEASDLLVIGGWIDKGVMNKEAMEFIEGVKNKKVAFFFTLGAYPTGMHAFDCVHNMKKVFEEGGNEVIAHYHSQGAIDPKLIQWMTELSPDHPHGPDEDRLNRWGDASKHPNEEDFNAAKNFAATILKCIGE